MNQALFLGGCQINNSIIPESFEYYWQPPPAVYDPAKAKELRAAAGFPNGFDAGPFTVDSSYSNMAEAAVDYLQQVGIRCKLVPMNAPLSLPLTPTKSLLRGYSARRAVHSATPRRGSPRSSSRAARTSMAAIPTSTNSSHCRPTNSTRRSGRRSSKRCSGWSTRRRSMRRSGNSLFSTVSARGWASPPSTRSPASPIRRRSRTSQSRAR
jgi:hypothetical protein